MTNCSTTLNQKFYSQFISTFALLQEHRTLPSLQCIRWTHCRHDISELLTVLKRETINMLQPLIHQYCNWTNNPERRLFDQLSLHQHRGSLLLVQLSVFKAGLSFSQGFICRQWCHIRIELRKPSAGDKGRVTFFLNSLKRKPAQSCNLQMSQSENRVLEPSISTANLHQQARPHLSP